MHNERTLGGRTAEGALGPAILGLTMAVGRFSGQAIAGRFQDLTIILSEAAMACAGGLVAAVAISPAMAYVGFAMVRVSVIAPVALALVGQLVPPPYQITAVARGNVIGFGAFLLAPTVMHGIGL